MLNSLAFSLTVLTASAEGAAYVVALMMAPLRLSFHLILPFSAPSREIVISARWARRNAKHELHFAQSKRRVWFHAKVDPGEKMDAISITVNGQAHPVDLSPTTPLLWLLPHTPTPPPHPSPYAHTPPAPL